MLVLVFRGAARRNEARAAHQKLASVLCQLGLPNFVRGVKSNCQQHSQETCNGKENKLTGALLDEAEIEALCTSR